MCVAATGVSGPKAIAARTTVTAHPVPYQGEGAVTSSVAATARPTPAPTCCAVVSSPDAAPACAAGNAAVVASEIDASAIPMPTPTTPPETMSRAGVMTDAASPMAPRARTMIDVPSNAAAPTPIRGWSRWPDAAPTKAPSESGRNAQPVASGVSWWKVWSVNASK